MLDKWILDCSAMAAVVLSKKEGDEVSSILEQAVGAHTQILVPALFWFEMGNVIVMAVRRKRLPASEAHVALSRLYDLPIGTDPEYGIAICRRNADLAVLHNLTFYDAAYLELADRTGAYLKTFDDKLLSLRSEYPWIR